MSSLLGHGSRAEIFKVCLLPLLFVEFYALTMWGLLTPTVQKRKLKSLLILTHYLDKKEV